MHDDPNSLEMLWDAILSREYKRIVEAYIKLNPEEQKGVLVHLGRMTRENGWHVEQVRSAQAALEAIHHITPHD